MKKLLLLALSIGSAAAAVDCPGGRSTGTIQCRDFSMFVVPGTCERFTNPCVVDGEWAHRPAFDGFRLEESDRPATVSVHEERAGGVTTRSICSAPGSGNVVRAGGDTIVFIYGRGDAFGTGHLSLVVSPL